MEGSEVMFQSAGKFTPETSGLTNLASVTVLDCSYIRLGSITTMTVRGSTVYSGAGPLRRFNLSLPFVGAVVAGVCGVDIGGSVRIVGTAGDSPSAQDVVIAWQDAGAGPATFNAVFQVNSGEP